VDKIPRFALCSFNFGLDRAIPNQIHNFFFQVAARTGLQRKVKRIIACFLPSVQITQLIGSFVMLLLDHGKQHSSMSSTIIIMASKNERKLIGCGVISVHLKYLCCVAEAFSLRLICRVAEASVPRVLAHIL